MKEKRKKNMKSKRKRNEGWGEIRLKINETKNVTN